MLVKSLLNLSLHIYSFTFRLGFLMEVRLFADPFPILNFQDNSEIRRASRGMNILVLRHWSIRVFERDRGQIHNVLERSLLVSIVA